MDHSTVTIVSGLPRSGTSMMMRMLEAGGMEILADGIRVANEDNPRGYYEFERVKQIESDQAWLEDARGKVVKMISALLKHLPEGYNYKVIFMHRKMAEILASQKRMLVRREEAADRVGDAKMAEMFEHHLSWIESWLAKQSNFEVIYVSYNDILKSPVGPAKEINQFLGDMLDEGKMVSVIEPSLYRQRH